MANTNTDTDTDTRSVSYLNQSYHACKALVPPFQSFAASGMPRPNTPAWPPNTHVAPCDPPPMTSDACDLRVLAKRVADATCYTRYHPQAIFYRRWNT